MCIPTPQAGDSQCYLNLRATDPDSNDDITYSLLPGNNSQRFHYLDTTDRLTFAIDYDVDSKVLPQSVIMSVEAKDSMGLTATSQISVSITDANDNTCEFANSVQSSTVNQGSNPGKFPTSS